MKKCLRAIGKEIQKDDRLIVKSGGLTILVKNDILI